MMRITMEQHRKRVGRGGASRIRDEFFGALSVMQAMLPLLRKAPAGRIVNLSSMSGPGKLTAVTSSSGGALTLAEVRLLSAFRLMDNDRRGGLQRINSQWVRSGSTP
jgi:hypothetical protein